MTGSRTRYAIVHVSKYKDNTIKKTGLSFERALKYCSVTGTIDDGIYCPTTETYNSNGTTLTYRVGDKVAGNRSFNIRNKDMIKLLSQSGIIKLGVREN
jgi:hypothetical protein